MSAVNVNLQKCTCHYLRTFGAAGHYADCPGTPVLIPCPVPRGVTFEVRLGECTSPGACTRPAPMFMPCTNHLSSCPARLVRVSCSISGKTWEESEVTECEVFHEGRETSPADMLRVCRDRWGWLKSAMLGHSLTDCPDIVQALRRQRDSVFAALADMARAEEAAYAAEVAWGMAMKRPARDEVRHPDPSFDANVLPSQRRLSAYVERLIEQVGVL